MRIALYRGKLENILPSPTFIPTYPASILQSPHPVLIISYTSSSPSTTPSQLVLTLYHTIQLVLTHHTIPTGPHPPPHHPTGPHPLPHHPTGSHAPTTPSQQVLTLHHTIQTGPHPPPHIQTGPHPPPHHPNWSSPSTSHPNWSSPSTSPSKLVLTLHHTSKLVLTLHHTSKLVLTLHLTTLTGPHPPPHHPNWSSPSTSPPHPLPYHPVLVLWHIIPPGPHPIQCSTLVNNSAITCYNVYRS